MLLQRSGPLCSHLIRFGQFTRLEHTMEHPLVMRILASSVNLASRASTIVRNILASKDLEIVDKGVNDLQSKADRDAQRFIVGSLSQSFPGLKIIGEEGKLDDSELAISPELTKEVIDQQCPSAYLSTKLSDVVVWVDPLDGTKEFTEGIVEHVTILIGISVHGKPVAGVIAQPFYHDASIPQSVTADSPRVSPSKTVTRTVWALDGLGVFGLTPRLPAGQLPYPLDSARKPGDAPHIIVVTRSHPTPALSAAIEACYPTKVIRAGGCGNKILMLLEGRAHVYVFPSPGTKRWDTCASEAVLAAAGGRLTDIRGQQYNYAATPDPVNHGGILATPVADWLSIYAELMPKTVLDSLSFK
ncbi:3'(2'),5'-bisphosphate nucleotidase 1 [Clonorchis sinensis]|uniref:3'(2'),5'-bisphosphate nucleotidase 1 n=1 Tax=Clonorchis sinensis TaxID=79923 RepID=A0A8T1M603_CLOSI|nr:3'(2'),5'-bisphosphate nucleotidase 1 [Clonorchis sinensis]